MLLSNPHDRVHEDEADRLAMELLARAGFDPGLALGFWSRALTGALTFSATDSVIASCGCECQIRP